MIEEGKKIRQEKVNCEAREVAQVSSWTLTQNETWTPQRKFGKCTEV